MKSLLCLFDPREDLVCKAIAILIVLSSITGGILLPQPFYFGSLAVLGLLIVFNRPRLTITNGYVLTLLAICAFSLLMNNPPFYFRAWQRLGVYSMVVLTAGPIIVGSKATILRMKILQYFIYLGALLSIGSFFAYFLGINLFVRDGEFLEISAGRFSGLMNHSMVLGPIAGLSCIYLFIRTINTRRPAYKYVDAVLTILCLLACFLSASRAAVGATIVGIMVVLFRLYYKRISKFYLLLFVIISVAAATFPIWGGMTDFLVEKQLGNEAMGSVIYSREQKIDARIQEFLSSPIYGIGYNVVDPKLDGVIIENGQIEPGSSWFAVASMTGILGLICFSIICFRALKRAWGIESPFISGLLGGCLVFFFIHLLGEGYIFAPKNCLSLLFWLIIAVIDGCWIDKGAIAKLAL